MSTVVRHLQPCDGRCDHCGVAIGGLDLELVLRLVLAAVVGAIVGIEREVHAHPAGLRTHLLVSLGSCVFTILSFSGFSKIGPSEDPTRIAAQIVSGIGFLGAGAILKEGVTVRGLTTAASLWTSAALGMASGVGQYAFTVAATALVLFSLWPLQPVATWLEGARRTIVHLRLEVHALEDLGRARETLRAAGIEVTASRSRRLSDGRFEVRLDLRRRRSTDLYGALRSVSGITGVVVSGVDQSE